MFFRERRGGSGIARKQFEKCAQTLGVKAKAWRQLPKNRSEFFTQCEHARGKEIGERRFNAAQLLHVSNEPAAFDGKYETGRRRIVPTFVTRWQLKRIKRAVDFDRIESVTGEFELAMLRQIRWVKFSAPARVAPGRNAHAQFGPSRSRSTRYSRSSTSSRLGRRPCF